MANDTIALAALKQQLAARKFAPVYLLHGEEGYYIDLIVKMAEDIIDPADRDFNLYTLYAPEVSPDTVMDACRRYPMMSDVQVVILKEAQAVTANYLKALKPYVQAPSPTTVLFIASRGEKIKSTELANAVAKAGGVTYESRKLTDNALAVSIKDFVTGKGLSVDPKALSMLRDFVGSDLSRLYNEVDKLTVTLPSGAMITPEVVERNIGVSKDFNNYEYIAAVASRRVGEAMKIVDYFKHNPKPNPVQVTAASLYHLFSNMLLGFYAEDKSERGLLGAMGFKWPRQLTDIAIGMNHYNAAQTVEILSAIKVFDGMTKGNGSRMDPYDLLRDLTYRIFTATGKR